MRAVHVNPIQPLSALAICSSFEHAHKGSSGALRLQSLILFVFYDGKSFWKELNCDVSDFNCSGTLPLGARRETVKRKIQIQTVLLIEEYTFELAQ